MSEPLDRLGVLVSPALPDPTEFAVEAERLGYDSVWTNELWWESGVVRLTDIAARTDSIDLGTAILNVYSRSPAVLAMTAATLDRVSDGRFSLGVGTSTEKAVEDLHGMAWDDPNPVRRAHETVELTREFLTGSGRVEYDGESHHAADFPALGRDVPIYHAALGPANRRVVARLCDGWLPHNVPFPALAESFDYIAEHAEEAGRDPEAITVAPYVPSCVAEDADTARQHLREHVAYYVGNGEGYRRAVAKRFPDAADEVAEQWRDGNRPEAAAAVTDEMVAALGVAGTPDDAREQLRTVAEMDVVDRPLVVIPNGAEAHADRTLAALAPERP
ncbi:LLM class flavin-dependent oxidoreductase [Halomarina oriensis]|uniref:LLM class flavin-dependent oxidoreductase n=1 Tax=Halomarina oriensis TaxID=671145 RepID=A0A6B0GIF0_9EURY|nr:LLM class flavin-dependent oxidoreductase [Halomarina oriensis]MWG33581.1 LLM class flavin-dependent oxidoreductase [Halomarina oriensis]